MGSDLLPPGDLQQRLVSPYVPRSEEQRGIWGSQANMDHIESALINARAGYMTDLADLGREILDLDPHMSGVCSKRFGSLQACGYEVTAPPHIDRSEKKLADEIAQKTAQILAGLNSFPERVKDLAWANFDGRAAMEIMWQAGAYGLPIAPVALQWIHPRRLSFDRRRRLHIVNGWMSRGFDPTEESALANYPGKFLTWLPRLFNEYPEREGLAPRVIYWGYFKRFDWRMRMKLMELFGIPWRIVHLDAPDGTLMAPEAMEVARKEATKLGGEAVGIFQRGMEVDVSFPPERSGQFFSLTGKEIDDQVSKLVLGTLGTTDTDDTNRANGVVSQAQQDIVKENDGMGASARLTCDLARPIARAGWGPQAEHLAAIITIKAQPKRDQKAELDRIEKTMSFGVAVPEAVIREASGIRAPAPDETYVVMGKGGVDGFGNPVPGNYQVIDPTKPGGGPGNAPPAPSGGAPDPTGEDPDADPKLPGEEGTIEDAGVDGAAAAALKDMLGLVRCMRAIPCDASAAEERKPVPAAAVNGSPETLIERALKEGMRPILSWSATLLDAADGGGTGPEIHRRLTDAAAACDLEGFARALERRLVHVLALGAMDADWEAENDRVVKPVAFPFADGIGADELEALRLAHYGLAGGVVDFATKPFLEAMKIFKAKNILPKRAFDRLTAEAKRRAFTAARLTNQRMLETCHAELSRALEDGRDLREFRMMLGERLELAGWSAANPSHVENVFRTNIMGAYNSGRDVQMRQPAVLAARPFWQILGVSDARTRKPHKAALGKVLRADDPFWKKAPPPFGFQCRCRKVARSAEAVKRMGLEVVSGSSLRDLPDEGWSGGDSLFGG